MPVPWIYVVLSPALLSAIVVGLLAGVRAKRAAHGFLIALVATDVLAPVLWFGYMFVELGLRPFGPWEYDGSFLELFLFLQLISAPAGLLSALGAVACIGVGRPNRSE